ncbi:hypothetical protein AVEN_224381-1 [Araneus ventricosus]|uniref:Uncharacterized protein n=1 Tax=Araneus ventricosus TaxID=182803 RepID=A0A4Y2HBC9_ARAVE|nr:hypothetical protein AVEN_224381-1 [Araneus ventricosus]
MADVAEAQALVMRRRRSCIVGGGVVYTCPFMCPHKKKSNGVKSGSDGLVAMSRPRERIVAGSRPDSTEDPQCMGPAARQITGSSQMPSRWCGAEASRGSASSGVVLVI